MIRIQSHKDIPYLLGSGSQHQLDIYFPQITPAMVPLVIYIHGGAWRTGDKSEFSRVAEGLIRSSNDRLAVAVINYTLSTPINSVRHPGHLMDTMAAVQFLVTDQSYPGRSTVDHTRVYLVGHSAGAHMSTLLALSPNPHFEYLSSIRGVLGIGGIYDIPKLLKTNPSYSDFIDMAFLENQHLKASPNHMAKVMQEKSKHIRFMVVNSAADELVGADQAAEFASQLVCSGYKNVTLVVRDLGSHEGTLETPEFWNIVVGFVYAM
ncbi:hypothetical protein GGF46_005192 [Coemansia sp. RSA 552]|nr:hypothetical protein GGF46_005192 [Coemansia sp. RSA 552]